MSQTTQESSIAAQLRDDILRGQYRCGERLPSERDLAERFGVHRSTIRSAFKRLEQLGIADIRPGGARVSPLDEASLDILDPMLALDDPPDAVLVDQTLEVMTGFLAHAARLGTERAKEPARTNLIDLLDEMISTTPTTEQRGALLGLLSAQFTAAANNPVLKLMRHSLRTRYSDYVIPNNQQRTASHAETKPHLMRLQIAVRERNGADASEAIYGLTGLFRSAIWHALDGEPVKNEQEHGTRPTGVAL
jgi:GntR family transcriptional repressor for pyruvate dehydrogenase complex